MKFIEIENFPMWEGQCKREAVYRTVMLNADRIIWFYREDVGSRRIHILLDGNFGSDIIVRYTDRLWAALLCLDDDMEEHNNNV